MGQSNGKPWLDSRIHALPIEDWGHKPGNAKRINHLQSAMDLFSSFVDVVIVDGVPGEGYGDAHPWIPENRQGFRWKVTDFELRTGHFRAEVLDPKETNVVASKLAKATTVVPSEN
jgi:hypothetical protein